MVEVLPMTGIGRALTYAVPDRMRAAARVGSLVRIPLLNRSCLGVVKSLEPTDIPEPGKLKYLFEVLYDEPVLTPDLIQLATWMARYYASSIEAVYEVMVPTAVRRQMNPKMERLLSVAERLSDEDFAALKKRAPKQAALYAFLLTQRQPVKRTTILQRLGVSPQSSDTLVKKGVLVETERQDERVAYEDELSGAEEVKPKPVVLNEEQEAAHLDFAKSLEAGEFKTHLLHGVTGSGKTEVYLAAIRKTLALGGGVIFLVPEVALTPQTVSRLRTRLEADGEKIVVWHSHLSHGERFDAWFALVKGEARVVVGARSAVFAPVPNVKLIVVDEEHEPAYKQSELPRYHGRDVAVYRAMLAKAVCILGSATPSLETLYNAQQGNYLQSILSKRIDGSQLPIVHVVDMKREKILPSGPTLVSTMLAEKLQDRMDKGEQAILFINRRGFSKAMHCPECDHVAMCPHCDVSLTYHRTDERIRCHICGHQEQAPSKCPSCGSKKIRWKGFGTQRVEDVVQKIVPQARIFRIDADTMQKKNVFRQILGDFRTGKIDILVGTQMIAKGLDFPNVTLVGLIDADISLHVPDFRAGERTFQLLVQVSGRAGRGDKAGEVVVQTFSPQSPVIQFARRGDFEGYLLEELEQRKEFNYPPYRHIVRHIFRGRNPDKVLFFAEKWTEYLEKHLPHSIEIRGPAPAPLEKMKDFYRFHTWYFMGKVSRIVPDIVALRKQFPMDDDVLDVFDVDPADLV